MQHGSNLAARRQTTKARSKRPSVVVVAILVGITQSACIPGTSSNEGSGVFYDYDGMVDEFHKAQVDLRYPDGAEKASPPPQGDSGSFQEGWGESLATQDWNCAWGKRWIEVVGDDDAAATEAFDMYAAIVDTQTFKQNFEPTLQGHIRDIIDKARLGDTVGLREDIEANC